MAAGVGESQVGHLHRSGEPVAEDLREQPGDRVGRHSAAQPPVHAGLVIPQIQPVPSGRGRVDLTGKSRVRAPGGLDQRRQLVIGHRLSAQQSSLAPRPGRGHQAWLLLTVTAWTPACPQARSRATARNPVIPPAPGAMAGISPCPPVRAVLEVAADRGDQQRRREASVISGNSRGSAVPAPGLLAEIRARSEVMRSAAQARGASLLPPLLMLGTSERVGSNWLSDTLRPVMEQHNEPFRQQLGADHPLSGLNPQAVPVGQVTGMALGTYGRHWLVTFVTSKYGTARQGVKETNLFFALPSLLSLFPNSPVAVLSRSPLGVASSFRCSSLFTRWDYRSRYQQMITMTRSGQEHRYATLIYPTMTRPASSP